MTLAFCKFLEVAKIVNCLCQTYPGWFTVTRVTVLKQWH